MHKVIFYNVGNGDRSQIALENKKRLLLDFCYRADGEDPENELLDLKKRLREELKTTGRGDLDVVAFAHGDDDHISSRRASTAGCQLTLRGDPLNTTIRQYGARRHQ